MWGYFLTAEESLGLQGLCYEELGVEDLKQSVQVCCNRLPVGSYDLNLQFFKFNV